MTANKKLRGNRTVVSKAVDALSSEGKSSECARSSTMLEIAIADQSTINSRLSGIAYRLNSIKERLITGSSPISGCSVADDSDPKPLLGVLHDTQKDTAIILNGIEESLTALEDI